jgi:L,D-peptidoglycan transpeptidase YkuD (ErfK/YbiS/YcfS/YnhG family)
MTCYAVPDPRRSPRRLLPLLLATAVVASATAADAPVDALATDPGQGAMQRTNYTRGPGASSLPVATRVVVRKSARRLELLKGDDVLRSYDVKLGLQPAGHKEREGDFRTPEGSYRLTRRNPRSDFFLSIQVSYPDDRDVKRAKANGWAPGGSIMIHGLPNELKHPPDYYRTRDWTDGCIAVSNSDMVEIWLLTQNNVPIDILP